MSTSSKGRAVLAVNLGPSTTEWVHWAGGKTMFISDAGANWGGGSVKLQTKAGSGIGVDLATHSASGATVLDLPLGDYRVVIATATTVYSDLLHVPQ